MLCGQAFQTQNYALGDGPVRRLLPGLPTSQGVRFWSFMISLTDTINDENLAPHLEFGTRILS
jgi:hypothetical protein